jgi:hypothetical protein
VRKLVRAASGAVIALGLAVLIAAPAAATQPIRTVIRFDPGTRSFAAGEFCGFAVTSDRPMGARLTILDYVDGREASLGVVVRRTYSNPSTGKTFAASTNAHEVDWLDPTQLVRGEASGQFIYQLVPGDIGPGGVIVSDLTELYVQGTATYVYDATTGTTLSITIVGTTTDICASLS